MSEIPIKNIIDITEQEFAEKVIEQSSQKIILVDFWAPWCGPCKQLTPILEKVITKLGDRALLVKINIDENQQIAAQLNIQSIPAVFAFKDQKIVDTFQGVIPENKIIEFIEKNLGEKINKDFSEFYELINKLHDEKNYTESINHLENFIAENPEDSQAISLYIDSLVYLKKFNEADNFINTLDKKVHDNDYINASIKKLNIKKKNIDGPSVEDLKLIFQKKPNNIENINKLADKYFAENMIDDAFEFLLNDFKIKTDTRKAKILEFFEALGNENEKTQYYRKKLSSIMFS